LGNFLSPPPPFNFFFFFFFFFFGKLLPLTHLLTPTVPLWRTCLNIWIKSRVFPSTYSPINLKCVTFISTHLPTPHLFIYLPALSPSYLPTF
jgi:hypothetical protein